MLILVGVLLLLAWPSDSQSLHHHLLLKRQILFDLGEGDSSSSSSVGGEGEGEGYGALSAPTEEVLPAGGLSELLGDDSSKDILSRDGFSVSTRAARGSACKTPFNLNGVCSFINEPQCGSILQAITQLGLTEEVLNYLRQAISAPCGFDTTDYTMCCQTNQPVTPAPPTPPPVVTPAPPAPSTSAPLTDVPCGANDVLRIVGGTESVPGSWPWAVIVGRPLGTSFQVLCGGSIISHERVLTAAHCFVGQAIRSTHVRAGDHDVTSTSDKANHLDVAIKKVITHTGYTTTALQNDIALLHLEAPLNFRPGIGPVCLPTQLQGFNYVTLRSNPVIVGWGSTVDKGATVTTLHEATVKVIPKDSCAKSYAPITRVSISDNQVCAGTGSTDTCNGDSGGPLMTNEPGKWTLIGITSFGVKCGDPTFPGVYTRVDKFLDWITQNN